MILYMISDGHGRYIRKDFAGKYSPVRNEALGDTWEQRNKAKNVLQNQINKNIRNRYHVVEIETNDTVCEKSVSEENAEHHTEEVKKIIGERSEDDLIDKWENGIDTISDFVYDLEERKDTLNKCLSDIDKEITDIQHYIELGDKFSAYEGWLAFSMLRHRLKKRRKIKNELHIIMQLSDCKINSSMLSNIKDAIRGLENKVYTPRRLTNLFDNGERK